jgi:hypothetical protein
MKKLGRRTKIENKSSVIIYFAQTFLRNSQPTSPSYTQLMKREQREKAALAKLLN